MTVADIFQAGELVRVVIDRARYDHPLRNGAHSIMVNGEAYDIPASATVERLAPPQWPPRVGDVWTSPDGDDWFAQNAPNRGDEIVLRSASTGTYTGPEAVLSHYGPLTLDRRRGWTKPAADEDAPTRGEVDTRVRLATDLRAAADWIESHPEIPVSAWRDPGFGYCADSPAELARVAAQLGTEVVDDDGHLIATAEIDGMQYRAFHVPPEVLHRQRTAADPDDPKPTEPVDCCPDAPDDEQLVDAADGATDEADRGGR